MATRSSHVNADEAYYAANAGANQQHGDKQAGSNGAACSPHCPQEVDHQHCHQGGVAKLPVGPPGQQVLDCILACIVCHSALWAGRLDMATCTMKPVRQQ